ncbi:hypothetical protein ACP6NG_17950 [Brevibacterium casei]|uniref:hypothetical protein n=1 Tax=Brevibacterium casei TaxID=33889 RepID=UPI003F7FC0D6
MLERDIRLGNGLVIGDNQPVFCAELDLGDSDFSTQTVADPLSGYNRFGRDVPTRSEATFTFYSNRTNQAEANESLRKVMSWWASASKMKPGAYTKITMMLGGEERTIYGRPRKYNVATDKLSRRGVTKVVASFERQDSLFYASEDELELKLYEAPRGGFRFPARFPVSTGYVAGTRQGITLNEDATAPSPFTARFYGPCRNPSLEVGGKKLQLNISIPYDKSVIVDTREQSVKWSTGANITGALSQSSRLSQMRVPVGKTEVTYKAIDETQTTRCVLRWAPARDSL